MAKKTYKDLKQELDEVLSWFEGGEVDLDEAVAHYERGMRLVKELELYLKDAENKVTKIKASHSNSV